MQALHLRCSGVDWEMIPNQKKINKGEVVRTVRNCFIPSWETAFLAHDAAIDVSSPLCRNVRASQMSRIPDLHSRTLLQGFNSEKD